MNTLTKDYEPWTPCILSSCHRVSLVVDATEYQKFHHDFLGYKGDLEYHCSQCLELVRHEDRVQGCEYCNEGPDELRPVNHQYVGTNAFGYCMALYMHDDCAKNNIAACDFGDGKRVR